VEGFGGVGEFGGEAVFDLAEVEVQVGFEERVGGTADDGGKEGAFSSA